MCISFILLLSIVPIFGYEIKGATRWISFNYFSIQSELLKGRLCMLSWFCYLYIKTNNKIYLVVSFIMIFFVYTSTDYLGTLLIYISIISLTLILYFRNLKLLILLGLIGLFFLLISYFFF